MTVPSPDLTDQGGQEDGPRRQLEILKGIAAHAETRLVRGDLAWKDWLEQASRHGRHGFTNTLLIPAQMSSATDVRSYGDWQKQQRQVRRGETGIRIISQKGRARTVFDITQTDGEPRDERATDVAKSWEQAARLAAGLGFYADRIPGWAYLGRPERRITVDSNLDEAPAVTFLVHQLAHVLRPGGRADAPGPDSSACHGARRAYADSVAYLVLAELGLPVAHLNFPSPALWAGTDARANPAATIRAVGREIIRTGTKLRRRLAAKRPSPERVRRTSATAPEGATKAPGRATPGETDAAAPSEATRERLLAALADAHHFYRDGLAGSWSTDYLAGRGVEPEVQERWEVGHARQGRRTLLDHLRRLGHADQILVEAGLVRRRDQADPFDVFRDRVLFPLRNQEGAVVGFIGRRRDDADGPKYLNTPETVLFRKGETLFGLHEGRNRLAPTVRPLIVEGPLDAIAVNTVLPETYVALAPCGTAITSAQLDALADAANLDSSGLVLALDGDPAGRAGAVRASRVLSRISGPVEVALLPPSRDPADLLAPETRAPVGESLLSPVPLADLIIDESIDRFGKNLDFAETRLAAARVAARAIAQLPPAQAARQVLRVAERTRMDPSEVTAAVAGAISPEPRPTPPTVVADFPSPPLPNSGRPDDPVVSRPGPPACRARSDNSLPRRTT
ncbi:toprim domain-containing protein [Actinomadura roseirufa]|uniref:toprim domain-containing protein n=1 Tax=Actinomadura roseirufa TaxID=2094049 RepID=UPI001040E5C5|nr:toprim domain-containing protein [Actinomadura roseirufa]